MPLKLNCVQFDESTNWPNQISMDQLVGNGKTLSNFSSSSFSGFGGGFGGFDLAGFGDLAKTLETLESLEKLNTPQEKALTDTGSIIKNFNYQYAPRFEIVRSHNLN